MDQIVLRNRKEYEITVNTDSDFDMEYLPYLMPECSSPDPDLKYFSKTFLPNGNLIIKLSMYDGIDRFGRYVMKSHNLIFDKEEYEEEYLRKGLPYYITPLLDGYVTNESDILLEPDHFRNPDISKIKPYDLLYDLLSSKKVAVFMDIYQPDVVMMIFSVLDFALPPEVNDQISILSYIPESMVDHLDANIAFYHTSRSDKSDKKITKNKTENSLKNYLDNLAGPYHRHSFQADLMLGNISDTRLTAKFRKNFHVLKDGTVMKE